MIIEKIQSNGNIYLDSISDFENVFTSKQILSNCISINFINKGTQSVDINGLVLAEGESLEVSQNTGFIDRTLYNIRFFTEVDAENNLVIIRILPKNQS